VEVSSETVKRTLIKGWLSVLAVATVLALTFSATAAPNGQAKPLRMVGRVTAGEATIHDAFALDQGGGKLGYIVFTGKGAVQLHVGPPGGKTRVTDLANFSGAPEKILTLAGYWFVVSNEGSRRAAIVDPAGRIRRQTGSFDDCELSRAPSALVTYSQTRQPNGDRTTIQTYRPDGSTIAVRSLLVTPGGTMEGDSAATFLGFSKSHLQAMVQKPGAYNRRSDAREPPQFALYDVMTGKTGPGKMPPKLDTFLDYIRKRAEKPDLDAVIVLAAGQAGFELVGPGEKVRPLNLVTKPYDVLSLQQVQVGSRVVFSLVADRPEKGNMEEAGRFAQAFFSLEPASGKVTALGEISLPDKHPCPWSAGGNKIAVLRKAADGGHEIAIYSR
jgi:hypothetical protein